MPYNVSHLFSKKNFQGYIRCLPNTLRKFLEVNFNLGLLFIFIFIFYFYLFFMILLWSLVLSVNEVGKLHNPCEFSHLIFRVHCLSVGTFLSWTNYLFDVVVWRNDSDCMQMIQCNHLPSAHENLGKYLLTSCGWVVINRPTNLLTHIRWLIHC